MSFFTPNSKCRRLGLGRSVNKDFPNVEKKHPDVVTHQETPPNGAQNNTSDKKLLNSSQKRKYRLGTHFQKNYKKKKLEFVEQSFEENATLSANNGIANFDKLPCAIKNCVTATSQDLVAASGSVSSCSSFLDNDNEISEFITKDVEAIAKEVEEKREILSKLKEHENNVCQLRATIEQWRSSLIISLNELSSKFEPNKSPEEILDLLNIPIKILNTQ